MTRVSLCFACLLMNACATEPEPGLPTVPFTPGAQTGSSEPIHDLFAPVLPRVLVDEPAPRLVDVLPPPPIDTNALPLPMLEGHGPVLIEVAGSRIVVDPTGKDAITALGACADLISYCFDPPAKLLGDCVQSAPRCATSEPWREATACCPAACADAYQARQSKGEAPLSAFETVFFRQPDCFPGVRAALEAR